jgi:DNA-directed RNA polymerase specialized sigma24 family protein
MSARGSVTYWIEQLKAGDAVAAQQLWERYFRHLVTLARGRLLGTRRCAADEEDVALSAFDSFCRGAERGQFPHLSDRDDLWRLLVTLTAHKASHLRRDAQRQKRGGGAVFDQETLAADGPSLEQIVGREPTPEFAAQVAEEYQRLLDCLGDAELRAIAVWKMEGDTTEQIAAKLGRSPRTVERRLGLIRSLWENEDRR